jgi:exodeoxyribonuclease-3
MKLISWNVNGIRAAVKKGLVDIIHQFNADVFCVQETKAQDGQVLEALNKLSGYFIYSHSAVKKGYSGVAILSKEEPLSVTHGIQVEEHDQEGRVITAEYPDYYLVNVYVPNSGAGLKRLDYRATWDKDFAHFLEKLKIKKPVIVTGDFNVAHQAIDLKNDKSNYNKTSGYTEIEINGLDAILATGLIDSYRMMYPNKVEYTFWSTRFNARANNAGWRIDYFLASKKIANQIKEATIHSDIMGSDHCPIELVLK